MIIEWMKSTLLILFSTFNMESSQSIFNMIVISSSPWKILSQCECSILSLDSTKIDCTTLLSNSTRSPLCSNHVYMHILCFKFGQQLSRGSGAKLSPSFTFQPLFPRMTSSKVSSCKAIWGKRWLLGKRFELEIVNSYLWLLTSFLQISHTCWGVQLNDHHSKNDSRMINNMKKTQNKQHFILNMAMSFM